MPLFNATRFRDDVIEKFQSATRNDIPATTSAQRTFTDSYFISRSGARSHPRRSNSDGALVDTPTTHAADRHHKPPACHHSYVQFFVDECNLHNVPEDIIVQHVLFMVRAMQDGIYMFSELHRKGEEASSRSYDRRVLLQLDAAASTQHHHTVRLSTSPSDAGAPSTKDPSSKAKRKKVAVSRGTQAHSNDGSPLGYGEPMHAPALQSIQRGDSNDDDPVSTDASFAVQSLEPALLASTSGDGGDGPSRRSHGADWAPSGIKARRAQTSKRTELPTHTPPTSSAFSLSTSRRVGHKEHLSAMSAKERAGRHVPVGTTRQIGTAQRRAPREPHKRHASTASQSKSATDTARVIIERHESFRETIDRLATPKHARSAAGPSSPLSKAALPTTLHHEWTLQAAARARDRVMHVDASSTNGTTSSGPSLETTPRRAHHRSGVMVDGRCFARRAASSTHRHVGSVEDAQPVPRNHHEDPSRGRPYKVDESPLVVPRRRQLDPTLLSSASCQLNMADETVQTQSPVTANAAVMAMDGGQRTPILVDDATQFDPPPVGGIHRSLGAVRLPPPTDSPQFRRYLQDTRDALASVDATLRRRRLHDVGSGALVRTASPPPVAVHTHSTSPLRWQRSGTTYDDPKRHTSRDVSEVWGNVSDLSSEGEGGDGRPMTRRQRSEYL